MSPCIPVPPVLGYSTAGNWLQYLSLVAMRKYISMSPKKPMDSTSTVRVISHTIQLVSLLSQSYERHQLVGVICDPLRIHPDHAAQTLQWVSGTPPISCFTFFHDRCMYTSSWLSLLWAYLVGEHLCRNKFRLSMIRSLGTSSALRMTKTLRCVEYTESIFIVSLEAPLSDKGN